MAIKYVNVLGKEIHFQHVMRGTHSATKYQIVLLPEAFDGILISEDIYLHSICTLYIQNQMKNEK